MVQEIDVSYWRRKLRAIAAHWTAQWAWYQDQRALVDDLEAVGWIALLELGPTHPRLRWELQNRYQNAICQWLYGVTRGQRPRQALPSVHLSNPPDALTLMSHRELLIMVGRALRPDQRETCWRAAYPRDGREYRIPSTRRFRTIQRLARMAAATHTAEIPHPVGPNPAPAAVRAL